VRRVLAPLVLIALLVPAGCGGDEPGGGDGGGPPAAAERFLDEFVDADGRVVRHDQGGDTVSEGQAYAMLVAAEIGDRERFDRIWSWTARELQGRDGLLAWQWRDGRVADREPAADADLDAAVALRRAADRFDRPAYAREARRIARAALRRETARTRAGSLLVAGPWARERRVVNPSYLDPGAFAELGGRWTQIAEGAREAIGELLERQELPPDWAEVKQDGTLGEAAAPNGGAPPQFGWEAVRLPLRLAAACDDDASRELAARMWEPLRRDPGRLPRGLDGAPWGGPAAAGMAGAAAAAAAAGDDDAARELLASAEQREREQPTYFGSALLALAHTAWDPAC
jgi:endoglucanase